MLINKILIIIIIIYLLFLHNKKKYIEKFSLTDDIKTVVNNLYNNELNPIFSLSNLLKILSNNSTSNNLKIFNNLNISGNIYSKKDIKNYNGTSLNDMKSYLDIYKKNIESFQTDLQKELTNANYNYIDSYNLKGYIKNSWRWALGAIPYLSNKGAYLLTTDIWDQKIPMISNGISETRQILDPRRWRVLNETKYYEYNWKIFKPI